MATASVAALVFPVGRRLLRACGFLPSLIMSALLRWQGRWLGGRHAAGACGCDHRIQATVAGALLLRVVRQL